MVTGNDAVDAEDLTSPARGPDAPPAGRRPPLRRGRASAAVAVGVLVAAGVTAHLRAPAPPLVVPEATAYQDAVQGALREAAPSVPVQWVVGSVSSSGSPQQPPVDVQREGPVAGPLDAAVSSRVGYRVLDGLTGDDPRPCRVPDVRVPAWRTAPGAYHALSCRPLGDPGGERHGDRRWALREGTSTPSAPRGEVVVLREVVLVQPGRACSVAAWAVGPGAAPPLGLDALRRAARALAGVRGAPA